LAKPKPFHPSYRDDRRSVYWVEKEPLRAGPDGYTVSIATPRVTALSKHKNVDHIWTPHRPTPVWPVARGAMSASASSRLEALAQHRRPQPTYSFDRSPQWGVSGGAASASASSRLEQLAQPKPREEQYTNFDPYWGFNWGVSAASKSAKATERLEHLAEHKNYHKDFAPERPIRWDVTSEAMEAIASLRLQQLARPRSRTMIKDDYDPYKVSVQARKARATPRLDELSIPIPRKVRQKIVLPSK